jgi:hypothetical protein
LIQYTRKPGESDCEWVSEGIQIGNLGSAIGVMGMWTGAKHQRSDPLGQSITFVLDKNYRFTPDFRTFLGLEGGVMLGVTYLYSIQRSFPQQLRGANSAEWGIEYMHLIWKIISHEKCPKLFRGNRLFGNTAHVPSA